MATHPSNTRNLRARRTALVAALVLSALSVALMAPGPAFAATVWREGAAGAPFHLASTGGAVVGGSTSDQSITLPYLGIWSAAGSAPWSVAPEGSQMLIAEPDYNRVRLVDRSGSGASIPLNGATSLNQPRWAWPTPTGTRLIADTYNNRVIEVDSQGNVTTPYGAGIGLSHPSSAFRTDAGTTLIADTDNERVIEVRADGSLGGVYGHSGPGSSAGYLDAPRCAVGIAGGRTLITDTGNSRLVIVARVDNGSPPVVVGSGILNKPTSAVPTARGFLVADTGNDRVVEITESGEVISVMSSGLRGPTGAARLPDGTTAIAEGASGLVGQGPGAMTATVLSSALDFGLPGAAKNLNSIHWNVTAPPGAGVSLYYSVNGSSTWKAFPSKAFSPPLSFTTLKYKATLTGAAAGMPSLNEVDFNWDYVPAPVATGGAPIATGPGTGTLGAGGSYTGTGTPVPEVIVDNGVRRGWVMESVGTFGTGKLPGPGAVPSQPLTRRQAAGLALLGGMWGIGIALQPIGKLLLALRNVIPFGMMGGR
jgi:hypothetical protein